MASFEINVKQDTIIRGPPDNYRNNVIRDNDENGDDANDDKGNENLDNDNGSNEYNGDVNSNASDGNYTTENNESYKDDNGITNTAQEMQCSQDSSSAPKIVGPASTSLSSQELPGTRSYSATKRVRTEDSDARGKSHKYIGSSAPNIEGPVATMARDLPGTSSSSPTKQSRQQRPKSQEELNQITSEYEKKMSSLNIDVTPVDLIKGPNEEAYTNQAGPPRGAIFIANYELFDNQDIETRIGSQKDSDNLSELFGKMGYKLVEKIRDKNKDETVSAMKSFSQHVLHSEVDSMVLIVMSHGVEDTADGPTFITSDGQKMASREVYEIFSDDKCPSLKGKPKYFMFIHCRGTHDLMCSSPHNKKYPQNNRAPPKNISLKDMFWHYSATAGNYSYRTVNGTYFVYEICQLFMNKACNSHLDKLIDELNENLPYFQPCEIRSRKDPSKYFYFNPVPCNDNSAQLGKNNNTYTVSRIQRDGDMGSISISQFKDLGLPICSGIMKMKYVLLVNNLGCYSDMEALEGLFTSMGFVVLPYSNVGYEALKNIIEEFKSKSHGECAFIIYYGNGFGETIVTYDNYAIHLNELQREFSDENCPELMGKAKIFIMNLIYYDGEISHVDERESDSQDVDSNRDDLFSSEREMFYLNVEIEDNHCDNGSLLTKSLVQVLKENKSPMKLENIVNLVVKRLNDLELQKYGKEIYYCETRNINFPSDFHIDPIIDNQIDLVQQQDDSSSNPNIEGPSSIAQELPGTSSSSGTEHARKDSDAMEVSDTDDSSSNPNIEGPSSIAQELPGTSLRGWLTRLRSSITRRDKISKIKQDIRSSNPNIEGPSSIAQDLPGTSSSSGTKRARKDSDAREGEDTVPENKNTTDARIKQLQDELKKHQDEMKVSLYELNAAQDKLKETQDENIATLRDLKVTKDELIDTQGELKEAKEELNDTHSKLTKYQDLPGKSYDSDTNPERTEDYDAGWRSEEVRRGPKEDHRIRFKKYSRWEGDSVSDHDDYVIPLHSDMLMMWASYPEMPAKRNFNPTYDINANVFIHYLCQGNSMEHKTGEKEIDETKSGVKLEKDMESLEINVKQATTIRGLPDNYRNESVTRGVVYIANYTDFENKEFKKRSGSSRDVKHLKKLFGQMGYQYEGIENRSKAETMAALISFRENKKYKDVDSMVLVMMSHGSNDKAFHTSDGETVTDQEVYELFGNKNCPLWKGKPKKFIFVYCRGKSSQSTALSMNRDTRQYTPKDASLSDIMVVHSTRPGEQSLRHPKYGSIFVYQLCRVFMEKSCDSNIDELMDEVNDRLGRYEGGGCEWKYYNKGPDFYFNPRSLKYRDRDDTNMDNDSNDNDASDIDLIC